MPTFLLSKRTALLAATVAGAALLAAGCGSSSDSSSSSDTAPAAEWADSLCSAINTWTTSITSILDPIKSGDISKDSLTTAVDDAKGATDTLISGLDGLGKPDTEAGQEAKDLVDKLSTDLKAEVTTIENELDSASGIAGYIAATPAVLTALGTMGTNVTSTVTTLQGLDAKGELETAFNDAASCADLTGS
ncbi:MAG: hypothetical protein LH654_05575 [Thermoleophilia bacterium]|nr:hypothetical protein [Thermoleophilia bacterium]